MLVANDSACINRIFETFFVIGITLKYIAEISLFSHLYAIYLIEVSAYVRTYKITVRERGCDTHCAYRRMYAMENFSLTYLYMWICKFSTPYPMYVLQHPVPSNTGYSVIRNRTLQYVITPRMRYKL